MDAKETTTDIQGNETLNYHSGQLAGGVLAVGVGTSLFLLGNKMGDRKIEKGKTTYYLHQWKAIITDKKNIQRYKDALKK